MQKVRSYYIVFCAALLFLPALSRAADLGDSFALTGATVYTAVGPPIENATILVMNGKIAGVGKYLEIPHGIAVIDVSGKVIIPGLVDAHSHLANHTTDDDVLGIRPIAPQNRALDALHLDVPDWMEALSGGVTTVLSTPGSGMRVGGQSITLKTFGSDMKKRILRESGDLKMAVNARNLSHIPNIHRHLIKAKEYLETWEKYNAGDKKDPPPKRDFQLEAFAQALKGETVVRVHIYYPSDIMTFLHLKDEFGFELQLIHSVEAWKVADELAKRNVGCICMPLALRHNVTDDQMRGNTTLFKAGVKIAMHTDHPVIQQKLLRICAGMSIRYGLPEFVALKSITINPAEMLQMGDRIGSIETGKDADLVLLDGPWYELKTRVDKVFVDGILAFDRVQYESYLQEDK